MNLGSKLKKLREVKNVSREQVSEYLSLSLNTYRKIENDERIPTIIEVQKIAEYFEIDPVIFISKENENIQMNKDHSNERQKNNTSDSQMLNNLLEKIGCAMENQSKLYEKQILLIEKLIDKTEFQNYKK